MNYVVVKPKSSETCMVSIVPEGKMIKGEFESWALRDGKQIIFANVRMHKLLARFYMLGNYSTEAMYGYSFTEMCAIMNSYLGPSDRLRAKELNDQIEGAEQLGNDSSSRTIWALIIGAGITGLSVMGHAIKFIVLMCIIPFILMFFNRHK